MVTGTDHSFSHLIDDWEVTNQQKSGRCWMFAALNLFRVGAMKAMNVKQFEFAAKYVNVPIDDYVCLVNDAR